MSHFQPQLFYLCKFYIILKIVMTCWHSVYYGLLFDSFLLCKKYNFLLWRGEGVANFGVSKNQGENLSLRDSERHGVRTFIGNPHRSLATLRFTDRIPHQGNPFHFLLIHNFLRIIRYFYLEIIRKHMYIQGVTGFNPILPKGERV